MIDDKKNFNIDKIKHYWKEFEDSIKEESERLERDLKDISFVLSTIKKLKESGSNYFYEDSVSGIDSNTFKRIFNVLEFYSNLSGGSYQVYKYFPTKTSSVILNGDVITVETMYGQGTETSIHICTISESQIQEEILDGLKDLEFLLHNADYLIKNSQAISKKRELISSLKNRKLDLEENMESSEYISIQTIGLLKKAIKSIEDAISKIEEELKLIG